MHRSRSSGQSLVISSVFQWQRLSRDPLLQAVGDGQVYGTVREGGGAGEESKPEWVAPSCGQTVFLSITAMLSESFRVNPSFERGVRLGPEVMRVWLHWHKVRWLQRGVFLSFFFVVFFSSLVCYAQFRSVVVSLQSPFQHTTDPEMTTLRVSQWLFVEGRRTKLKDQANMHNVFRHCFAKSHQGQLFSWRRVQEETGFLFLFFLFFFFCSTLHLLNRGNNNGLIATSFLHLYCNYLW